jgi:hypothetical protein
MSKVEEKQYQEIVRREATFESFFTILVDAVKSHVSHDFRMRWQWQQLKTLQDNLPKNHALIIMDYSENVPLQFSEETIASHSKAFSVSLFPVAIFYNSEENGIVLESLNIVTNDLRHDSHAVRKFHAVVMEHLRIVSPVQIHTIHRFTDGCAGQFRSRQTMRDILFFSEDFPNANIIANYGETSEFKNLCDGFGDHAKSPLQRAIISQDVLLTSPWEVFCYLDKTLSFEPCNRENRTIFRRKFFLLTKIQLTEINLIVLENRYRDC